MPINWYPGHMAKAKRMIEENLSLVDLILEVRDARLPRASANPDLAKLKKPRLVLLNKADLADPEKTKAWLAHFRDAGVPALAVTARTKQTEVAAAAEKLARDKLDAFAQKGLTRVPRALVAGIPNSGKSTLINSLAGLQKTKTEDRAGVTRGKQWVRAGRIDLLDTPGILWPRLEDQHGALLLALTGALNDETLDREELALKLIGLLRETYPQALPERYKITTGETPLEDYEAVCRARGFLLKKNEIDYARGALVLLDEFRAGRLGRMTWEEP